MKWSYLLFIIVFALAYGSLNLLIGIRGWQFVSTLVPHSLAWVYWLAFWIIALSYIIGRLGSSILPAGISTRLTVLGSYWMAIMYYLVIILLFMTIIKAFDHRIGFLPAFMKDPHPLGFGVVLLLGGILTYGSWNAHHPRVTSYDIAVPKSGGKSSELHIVAVSDIHLGNIVHNGRLHHMVEMVNALNPDLVLLPGDVIDESIKPFLEQKMSDTLSRLDTRYGTYAVLGNHEYIGGNVEATVHHLQEAGVKVLRDRAVLVEDDFYVVGRDESMSRHMSRGSRQGVEELLAGVDRSKPIILMDHQPVNLGEAERNGVDLQVSGHTHLGQIFPNHLITRRLFAIDYGHLQKGNFHAIVSSGYGTWGPPIRIGNTPEIVDIRIRFTGN